jgi:hypothetical protein
LPLAEFWPVAPPFAVVNWYDPFSQAVFEMFSDNFRYIRLKNLSKDSHFGFDNPTYCDSFKKEISED